MRIPSVAIYTGHTALQIAQGCIEEGLAVVIFGPKERLRLYTRFPAIRARLEEYLKRKLRHKPLPQLPPPIYTLTESYKLYGPAGT